MSNRFQNNYTLNRKEMYRGFNLNLEWYKEDYYENGKKLYESTKNQIVNKLDSFLTNDGFLDGSKLESDWFPQINADIFISHSHKDEKRAIAIAWWLYANFGLECVDN